MKTLNELQREKFKVAIVIGLMWGVTIAIIYIAVSDEPSFWISLIFLLMGWVYGYDIKSAFLRRDAEIEHLKFRVAELEQSVAQGAP